MKTLSFVRILGTGSFAPAKILSNFDLERIVDTSDEWITKRTGIKERRIAEEDVASSDLGYEASVNAIKNSSIDLADIDGIIVATTTPDYLFPSTACILQQRLSITKGFAFDLLAACSGFLYALQVGKVMIDSGSAENLLIVGAETYSKIINYNDRTTCVLFGDGAGATVITKSDAPGIMSIKISADGRYGDLLTLPGGGSRVPVTEESAKNGSHYLQMKGRDVFKIAVKRMQDSIIEVLEDAGIAPNQIDLFIPHQANYRILDALRERLDIGKEKVYSNLDKYGNTSAASIPIALDEAIQEGRAKEGDTILFSTFGGGLTWGSALIKL